MASKKEKILEAAQRLAEKGAFAKAAAELRRLCKSEPEDAQLWLRIAELEGQAENRPAALDAQRQGLTLMLRANPGDARLWLQLAELEEQAGKPEAATEAYQKGAEVYAERGAYLQAVAVYRNKLLALKPERVAARMHLAELYQHLGLLDDALEQYLEVAQSHERAAQRAEAKQILQRVLALEPGLIAAQVRLAELHIADRESAQAAELLRRVCQQLRQAGNDADYVKVAERLVFLEPEDRRQAKELIRVLLGQGNPMRALHHLQRGLQIDPEDTESLALLARVFQDLQQDAKAVQVLHELARIHDRHGRIPERNEVYREILRRSPGDAEAKSALGTSSSDLAARARVTPEPPPLPGSAAQPPPLPQRQGASGASAPGSRSGVEAQAPGAAGSVRARPPVAFPGEGMRTSRETSAAAPSPAAPRLPSSSSARALAGAGTAGGFASTAAQPAPPEVRRDGAVRRAGGVAGAAPPPGPVEAAPQQQPPAGRLEGASPPLGAAKQRAEEVQRLLTDIRVYIKYGLKQKALDGIAHILALDPTNIEALISRKEILLADGDSEGAALVLLRLAELCRDRPEQSERWLEEARKLGAGIGLPPGASGSAGAGQLNPPPRAAVFRTAGRARPSPRPNAWPAGPRYPDDPAGLRHPDSQSGIRPQGDQGGPSRSFQRQYTPAAPLVESSRQPTPLEAAGPAGARLPTAIQAGGPGADVWQKTPVQPLGPTDDAWLSTPLELQDPDEQARPSAYIPPAASTPVGSPASGRAAEPGEQPVRGGSSPVGSPASGRAAEPGEQPVRGGSAVRAMPSHRAGGAIGQAAAAAPGPASGAPPAGQEAGRPAGRAPTVSEASGGRSGGSSVRTVGQAPARSPARPPPSGASSTAEHAARSVPPPRRPAGAPGERPMTGQGSSGSAVRSVPQRASAAAAQAEAAAPGGAGGTSPDRSEAAAEPTTGTQAGPRSGKVRAQVLSPIAEALRQADFFYEQGLPVDAQEILEEVLASGQQQDVVLAKMAELKQRELERAGRTGSPYAGAAPPTAAPAPRRSPTPTMFGQVREPTQPPSPSPSRLQPAGPAAAAQPSPTPRADAPQGAPPQGAMDEEDGETHYDLGIAYMEMGLLQDAIQAFRTAMEADVKRAECHRLIGQCHLRSGNAKDSIAWLKRGLRVAGLTQDEELGLLYSLGEAHLALNDRSESRCYLEKVAEVQPDYPGLARLLRLAGGAPTA